MPEKICVRLFISGIVQGVFFRENTRQIAQELGITGWVKNLPDGRVEIVAEGEKEKIQDLIEWAKVGPQFAKVEKVETFWEEFQNEFNSFEIKY